MIRMLSAVAEAALYRPRAVLAGLAAMLALVAALAATAPDRLTLMSARSSGSESARAESELREALGQEAGPGVVIVTEGSEPVRSGVYRVALDVITSQIEANPEVARVHRGPTSRDGRVTALEVYFRDDNARTEQETTAALRRGLDPGPLRVLIGGEAGVLDDARSALWGELGPLELLALPVTVIVLLIVFGIRLAAGPALAGAIGTLGSLGVIGLVNEVAPLSSSAIAPAAVIAVALGIESCHLIAARHRHEASAAALSDRDAVHRAVEVSGRAVVIASLTAAAVASSLAVIPVLDARSAALGGAIAAILSGAVSLTAMPCLLVVAAERSARPAAPGESEGRGLWFRLESALTRRSVIASALVVLPAAGLVLVAAPGLRIDTVPLDAAGLPGDSEARRAEVRVTAELGSAVTAPVLVSREVAQPPDPTRLAWRGTGARPGSLGAREEVEAIRDRAPGRTEVGGRDAAALDANTALLDHLPLAAGGAALILAVVLVAFVFRSPRSWPRALGSAVVLAVASKLPAAAAVGLLVLTFQDGRLTGLLGYTPEGGPELVAVVAVVAAVATVSVARSVHFAATVVEEGELGFDATSRVPRAASLTLPGVAASTTVLVAATVVLAGADLTAAKEFGLATAAGLVLDLVFVRVLLAPGLARLSQ